MGFVKQKLIFVPCRIRKLFHIMGVKFVVLVVLVDFVDLNK